MEALCLIIGIQSEIAKDDDKSVKMVAPTADHSRLGGQL